jgi:hypothetical protein
MNTIYMKYTLLAVAVITFLFFTGCRKTPNSPNVASASAIKADFYFREGSYWIMKDSISGRIDSFVVRYNRDSAITISNPEYSYEETDMVIWEYNTNHALADSIVWHFLSKDSSFSLDWRVQKSPYTTVTYYPFLTYLVRNSFSLGSTYYPGADTGAVTNVIGNFNLNGLSFANTAVVLHHEYLSTGGTIGGHPYGYSDVFYITPGTGIVKISINHPQDSINRVWELQRWFLLK